MAYFAAPASGRRQENLAVEGGGVEDDRTTRLRRRREVDYLLHLWHVDESRRVTFARRTFVCLVEDIRIWRWRSMKNPEIHG